MSIQDTMNSIRSTSTNEWAIGISKASSAIGRGAQIRSLLDSTDAGAARMRDIGRQEAALRARSASVLEGKQIASFTARGVRGVSADALMDESRGLEGIDIARTQFLYETTASETQARGRSAAMGVLLGIPGDQMDLQRRSDFHLQRRSGFRDAPTAFGSKPFVGSSRGNS